MGPIVPVLTKFISAHLQYPIGKISTGRKISIGDVEELQPGTESFVFQFITWPKVTSLTLQNAIFVIIRTAFGFFIFEKVKIIIMNYWYKFLYPGFPKNIERSVKLCFSIENFLWSFFFLVAFGALDWEFRIRIGILILLFVEPLFIFIYRIKIGY